MNVCGQNFTTPIIERIQQTVNAEPDISRRKLSQRVCDWLDWYSPAGKPQDMSCRKALAELNPEIKDGYRKLIYRMMRIVNLDEHPWLKQRN